MSNLELHVVEVLEICDIAEVEDSIEVFGPQIELDLGEGSSIHDVEPPIEVAGVAPTEVVEVEEESSIEVVEARSSVVKEEKDQVEGTGDEPVPEPVEMKLGDRAVGAGEEPAHDVVEARTETEPVLQKVKVDQGVQTGDSPVRKAVKEKTGTKPVSAVVSVGIGDMPVRDVGEGDLFFEDYPRNNFENVGEYTPEEASQTPLTPAPEHPTG